jgi:ADP-ribose pyrophosphatase YjhB (NUDIX family)
MVAETYKFCSACGATVQYEIPQGDNRLRAVCTACKTIHYQNPKVVVGSVPVWDDKNNASVSKTGPKVLLCKRAIEPRYGFWTLPAGFMENAETTAQGAMRETLEEAGANIELGPLFSVVDVAHVNQVHLFYRAKLIDLEFAPGEESLEVQLFSEDQIPWDQLAFQTVATTLRRFFEDAKTGQFSVHSKTLEYRPKLT